MNPNEQALQIRTNRNSILFYLYQLLDPSTPLKDYNIVLIPEPPIKNSLYHYQIKGNQSDFFLEGTIQVGMDRIEIQQGNQYQIYQAIIEDGNVTGILAVQTTPKDIHTDLINTHASLLDYGCEQYECLTKKQATKK